MEKYKLMIQVLDDQNGCVFSAEVVQDAELFRAPGENGVHGLIGVKTALDFTIEELAQKS